MERVVDVAQYIFTEYKKISGHTIDEMKLQQLLYFVQRESFAILNKPMFLEDLKRSNYGPVCKEVRNCYTEDGMYDTDIKEITNENKYIAKNVILQYGIYESWKLSQLIGKERSWKNTGNHELLNLEDIKEDAKKVRPYDSIWDMYYDEFEDAK